MSLRWKQPDFVLCYFKLPATWLIWNTAMAGMTKDLHRLMTSMSLTSSNKKKIQSTFFSLIFTVWKKSILRKIWIHDVKRGSLMIKSKAAACRELFLFMDFICRRTLCVGASWETVNWEIDLLFSRSIKVSVSIKYLWDVTLCSAGWNAKLRKWDKFGITK